MNGLLHTLVFDSRIEIVCNPNQNGSEAYQAMEKGDKLRHRRHLDPPSHRSSNGAANRHHRNDDWVVASLPAEYRHNNRNRHARHAKNIASAGRFWMAEAAETQYEKDAGNNVSG